MAIRLTLAMPESAIKLLMEGYRSGDPGLMSMLKDIGLIGIVPHDELSLDLWENEGGALSKAGDTPVRVVNNKPYFSTLTHQYYSDYDAAFQDSRQQGGGAYVDFNLYYVHPDGTAEIVF
jgi:hypothetical protein